MTILKGPRCWNYQARKLKQLLQTMLNEVKENIVEMTKKIGNLKEKYIYMNIYEHI